MIALIFLFCHLIIGHKEVDLEPPLIVSTRTHLFAEPRSIFPVSAKEFVATGN